MLLNFGKGKNDQWASNHNVHHAGEFAIFQLTITKYTDIAKHIN